MSIGQNIERIKIQLSSTSMEAGRNPGDVQLVAVSKNFGVESIREAYEAGQRAFGENRVQELMEKIPLLPDDIQWHLIGTLQRNKVKYIVGKVHLIHSVDSLRLAQEISRIARRNNQQVSILLQVNIAQETTKSGFAPEELLKDIQEISELPGIQIKGLMSIAPIGSDPEEVRPFFRSLKELSGIISSLNLPGVKMQELSMGMSDDYLTAVEEGATIVRIGSRIFGQRIYY